jgi:hypothetical protein
MAMMGMDSRDRKRQGGRLVDDSITPAARGSGTADRNTSLLAVPVTLYEWTAHAVGTDDSRADRYRQLALCRAAVATCGARVATEFFDEDCRADYPWRCRPQGRSLLAALPGPGRSAGAVAIADPWCLFPRCPAAEGIAILARLAFRHVQLGLADSGMLISSAEEYALLGRLLTAPAYGAPPGGSASRPAVRDQRARGSQPRRPAAGLRRRSGEPR